jgi:adenylyl-sulfate kinase
MPPVDQSARAVLKGHRGAIVWFTGLSGAGKSTIAGLTEQKLHAKGIHTYLLDGDNLRLGLNRDLGFLAADRSENVRRAGEVAKLFVDAGLVVLGAFISPFRGDRQRVRDLVKPGEFVEIFVDTPLDECERRDPKGLYALARRGRMTGLTGVDAPYEIPENPDLILTGIQPAGQLADAVLALLASRAIIASPTATGSAA